MIYQMTYIIQRVLSNCFSLANKIFSKVGIGLTAAICVMVLVSSILRLFTARFIGSQIVLGNERKEARMLSDEAKRNKFYGRTVQNARKEIRSKRPRETWRRFSK